MAYRLKLPSGLVVEVDSSSELKEAVQALSLQPSLIPEHQQSQSSSPHASDVSDVKGFLKGLPRKQRLILNCLAVATGNVSDARLRDVSSSKTNIKLGGTIGAISKRAKKFGLTLDDVLEREIGKDESGRHYNYTMPDSMKAAINA